MVACACPGGMELPGDRAILSPQLPVALLWPQHYCSAPFVPGAPQLLMFLAFLSLSKGRTCLLGKRGFRGTMSCSLCWRLCRKLADRCSTALHVN